MQCSAVGRWPYWPHCTNPCLPRCSFFPCSLPARVSALHRALHCTAPCSVQCSQVQCGAVAGSASTAAAIPTVGHRAVSGLCTALSLPQTPQGKDLHSSKAFLYGEKKSDFCSSLFTDLTLSARRGLFEETVFKTPKVILVKFLAITSARRTEVCGL